MSADTDNNVHRHVKELEKLVAEAAKAVDDLGELAFRENVEDAKEAIEIRLRNNFKTQYALLCDAFDKLQRPHNLAQLKDGFNAFGSDLVQFHYESYTGSYLSPVQLFLGPYIAALEANAPDDKEGFLEGQCAVLENILRSTAAIMEQQKLEPKNETEMNRLMKKIISAAFPDTISPSIPTSVKTYKPELGVPSLKALAEYKFGDSEAEVKQCIDGIAADSRGYQADGKWTKFYAIIFMTGAFFTQAQIDEQFKQLKIGDKWKAIVLVGKGGRKKKADTQKPKSAPPAAPAKEAPPEV